MQKGIVKWFDNRKGYGFTVYNEENEVFVHFTTTKGDGLKSLDENQSAEFEIMEGNRGLQVTRVKKINN